MPEWSEDEDGTAVLEVPERLDGRRQRGPGGWGMAAGRGFGVRRAVAGGVAGVALMAGPVGLAKAVVPGDEADLEAGDDSRTLFTSLNRNSDRASEMSQVNLNEALAVQEVTVTEKGAAATTSTTSSSTTTTEPPSDDGDVPPDSGGAIGDPSSYDTWDALAECESGGDWSINTGNGYYGGLQFSLSSWQAVGGTGYPHENSREEQIHRGQILQARGGWSQWPSCSSQLGFR